MGSFSRGNTDCADVVRNRRACSRETPLSLPFPLPLSVVWIVVVTRYPPTIPFLRLVFNILLQDPQSVYLVCPLATPRRTTA